jgi:hypothetical protein
MRLLTVVFVVLVAASASVLLRAFVDTRAPRQAVKLCDICTTLADGSRLFTLEGPFAFQTTGVITALSFRSRLHSYLDELYNYIEVTLTITDGKGSHQYEHRYLARDAAARLRILAAQLAAIDVRSNETVRN